MLEARLPGGTKEIPLVKAPLVNFAVNNDGDYYPRYQVSFSGDEGATSMIHDGEYVYDRRPLDRWSTLGSPNEEDWIAVDFGAKRSIEEVELYVIDDGEGMKTRAPRAIDLDYWTGQDWKPVPNVSWSPAVPQGGRPYCLTFPSLKTSRLRATLVHSPGSASALTEFMAWGQLEGDYVPPRPPKGNIAFNTDPGTAYPKVRASFHDQFGGTPDKAIDGKIIFPSNPMNRWTSYGSPNKERDWIEIDFGGPKRMGRVVLHIFDDRGGVQAPKQITLQVWSGEAWQDIGAASADPAKPKGGMANTLRFEPITAPKLRVVFDHVGIPNVRSGATEIEVWAE